MRIFEIAVQSRVEHYVWGSLDYSLKKGKYDEKFRVGHYDGKGKVAGMLIIYCLIRVLQAKPRNRVAASSA
jgi:hypothetical protein